jgi:hypothetical protein
MAGTEEEYRALQIRFPVPLYDKLQERAKKSRRSLNAEVLVCLESYLNEHIEFEQAMMELIRQKEQERKQAPKR